MHQTHNLISSIITVKIAIQLACLTRGSVLIRFYMPSVCNGTEIVGANRIQSFFLRFCTNKPNRVQADDYDEKRSVDYV